MVKIAVGVAEEEFMGGRTALEMTPRGGPTVGERVLDWDVRTRCHRWRRLVETSWDEAVIDELSVGGARLLIPGDGDPREGRRVRVGWSGSFGTAVIHWVRPTDDPSRVLCGVTFEDVQPALAGFLARSLAEQNSALGRPVGDERWDWSSVWGATGSAPGEVQTYQWDREAVTK